MYQGTDALQQRATEGSNIYSFCEQLDTIFAKPLGFEPRPAGLSQLFLTGSSTHQCLR